MTAAGPNSGLPPEWSAADVKSRLDRGEPLALLDVREDSERAIAAVPTPAGAVDLHVPMGQVPARLDEIRDAIGPRPLVVYCHHGVRSMVVARWLAARHDGPVINLQGGIDAWSTEVDRAVPRY